MTADVRHVRPRTVPVRVTADALTALAREHANLPDTGIATILAALTGLHTLPATARWALYTEVLSWIDDLDQHGHGPEHDQARDQAHDTIHALVAQAVTA